MPPIDPSRRRRTRFGAIVHDLVEGTRRRAVGRAWWPRALALVWMAHVAIDLWDDPLKPRGLLNYPNVFAGLNLGIHELGHVVFWPFGELVGFAGGSILQCLAPIVALVMFARQGDDFAICVALTWLGTNVFSVGVYMADAVVRRLPLVSPFGGDPLHDWAQVFGRLGLLGQAEPIGLATKLAAMVWIGLGLAGGLWVVFETWRAGRRPFADRTPPPFEPRSISASCRARSGPNR